MDWKTVSGMMLTLLLTGMLTLAIQLVRSEPKTICVDDDNTGGPWDGTSEYPYQSITSALEHVSAGDTIYVYNGIYREALELDKTVSLIGEDRTTTIIDGGVVSLYDVQEVYISGFTMRGISLWWTDRCVISQNIVSNGYSGIYMFESLDNIISGNHITNNSREGILHSCFNNTITGNNITGNPVGIRLYHGGQSTISGNNIAENDVGVSFEGYSYTTFCGNNITANRVGVEFFYADHITVSENNITGNNKTGVSLRASSNNRILGNNIANNGNGTLLDWSSYYGMPTYSSGNTIVGNNITANDQYGIQLFNCSGNLIHHNNFVNNTEQVYSEYSANVWDDGYPFGGNFWSDHTDVDRCSGPNQDTPGCDGIWDYPYVIDGDNQDRYPLITVDGRLTGDLDGDCMVDFEDIVAIAMAYAYFKLPTEKRPTLVRFKRMIFWSYMQSRA